MTTFVLGVDFKLLHFDHYWIGVYLSIELFNN